LLIDWVEPLSITNYVGFIGFMQDSAAERSIEDLATKNAAIAAVLQRLIKLGQSFGISTSDPLSWCSYHEGRK
jgi:hypothetical protein